jgi:hypothetical protein
MMMVSFSVALDAMNEGHCAYRSARNTLVVVTTRGALTECPSA